MNTALLSVRHLHVAFTGDRRAAALTDLNFELGKGEVLGLIGESGSGKSVTLRTLLRLHAPGKTRVSGQIVVDGQDVLSMQGTALQAYRGGGAAMVFQEAGLAFDPVFTVGAQIAEAVRAHEDVDARTARKRALDMLERVQIAQAARRLDAYPHELSGGMRQRAMIALALACRPKLLLADEPTTALDATVQIQILLLLRELQRETGMAMIFVTHDIGAAVEVADRIAVMYAGRIVEEGRVGDIIAAPRHPYTQGLLASTVSASSRGAQLPVIRGAPPDLAMLPAGCAFAARCDRVEAQCLAQVPETTVTGDRRLACWNPLTRVGGEADLLLPLPLGEGWGEGVGARKPSP
jgi:peptide/nickel transport system ATP-binding protein